MYWFYNDVRFFSCTTTFPVNENGLNILYNSHRAQKHRIVIFKTTGNSSNTINHKFDFDKMDCNSFLLTAKIDMFKTWNLLTFIGLLMLNYNLKLINLVDSYS